MLKASCERENTGSRCSLPAVEAHQRILGRVPRLVTADASFYSRAQERAVQDKSVPWIAGTEPVRTRFDNDQQTLAHSHGKKGRLISSHGLHRVARISTG